MNFSQFMDHISEYESDTFSASKQLITSEEKIKMANKLLDEMVGQIDGCALTQILNEVREEK